MTDDGTQFPPRRRRRSLNAFPPIEYTLQQTARAVYCLVRGVGEPITTESAKAIIDWLEERKGVAVDRTGPSSYPGPDGSRYEWFLRIVSVDGSSGGSLDDVYSAARQRLLELPDRVPRQTRGAPSASGLEHELPLSDLAGAEASRLTAFLQQQFRGMRRQLVEALRVRRPRQDSPDARKAARPDDRYAAEELMRGLETREEQITVRERELAAALDELMEREAKLSAEQIWLAAERERLAARSNAAATPGIHDLRELLPRVDLDDESADLLQFELGAPYARFLAAMNDRCDIGKHPCCKRHEKVKTASGKVKLWWEVRLLDSVSEDYRLYYRHQPNGDRLLVRLRHKKDQETFFAQL